LDKIQGMYRKSIQYLQKWEKSKFRSPLLLRGARQVGKTWLVRTFGEQFPNFIEINLEENPEYIELFKRNKGNPQQILNTLQIMKEHKSVEGATLLFIDEIQESPDALLSLRYFKEKMPDIHVIAAGSLIEFALKKISFPVGRIDFYHIFPLDFEEFLLASKQSQLVKLLNQNPMKDIDPLLHEQLMKEFKTYTALGGLPEVIHAYITTKDLEQTQAIQQKLIISYRQDFNKYSSETEIKYVRSVFDSIPIQLGQKFIFTRVAPETKSRELHLGLNLLIDAGLAYKCYHSSGNEIPLSAEIKENKFKVFFFDTGLVQRLMGRPLKTLILEAQNESEFANQGSICESIVAQQLLSLTPSNETPELYYWLREAKSSSAEVDFLLAKEDKILPIEVKKGSRQSFKSLKIYMEEKNNPMGFVVSSDPFEIKKDHLVKVPFYLLHRIKDLLHF
jgi:predicted AAA+ superfamily ATPase